MLDWKRFTQQEEIKKGWSRDKKYCVRDRSGQKYLLRILAPEQARRNQELFHRLGQLQELPLLMSEALETGSCQSGVYTLYRWIEGKDLEAVLASLPADRQEQLGFSAGQMLQVIHSLTAPAGLPDWQESYQKKIDRVIAAYAACGQQLAGAEKFLAYIADNKSLLRARPLCFTHGDYHVGNMMLEEDRLVIIDFDRFAYADPWEEFNRISWCAAISPDFATARIQSYFAGPPPAEFFRLLALYISVNAISSLPWALAFGGSEIAVMQKQSDLILDWYNQMQDPLPNWYRWSRAARPVRRHYDHLIQENNDPFRDGPELEAHMKKFDGELFIKALKLAKTDRVLEIGVGTGRLARQVLGKCREFTGIDLSGPTIARARQNLAGLAGQKLLTGNFLSYPFSGHFDLIYSSLTLWHISDKAAFYKKASQLLLPGGRLVFTISRSQEKTLTFPGRPLQLYPDSPEETRDYLKTNGFIVQECLLTEYSLIFVAEKKH